MTSRFPACTVRRATNKERDRAARGDPALPGLTRSRWCGGVQAELRAAGKNVTPTVTIEVHKLWSRPGASPHAGHFGQLAPSACNQSPARQPSAILCALRLRLNSPAARSHDPDRVPDLPFRFRRSRRTDGRDHSREAGLAFAFNSASNSSTSLFNAWPEAFLERILPSESRTNTVG